MGNASAAPSLKPVAETSSRCVTLTQGITVAHNFEVINFSLLEGMGVGKSVSSKNFHVGGYDWNICLFPDGHSEEHKDYVSVYLNPEEGGGHEGVRVRFTFTILGKDGKVWHTGNGEHTFENSDFRGRGWPTFTYKSWRFRRMLRNNNDRFTVKCVATVIQEPRVEAVVVPEPSVQLKDDCLKFSASRDPFGSIIKTDGYNRLCKIQ